MIDRLCEKLRHAELRQEPFEHIVVPDLLNEAQFDAITREPSVAPIKANSAASLIAEIIAQGGEAYKRAGCADNVQSYIDFLEGRLSNFAMAARQPSNAELLNSIGLSLRIQPNQSSKTQLLLDNLSSPTFLHEMAQKLRSDADVSVNVGLYKFLSGYEIPPHTDSRRKELTFLLNLTPKDHCRPELGTHFHRLKPGFSSAESYWNSHPAIDRCWVPWEWVDTIRKYYEPNTLIAFRPSSKTLHSVQIAYDHLAFQRTTIIGNLWHTKQTDVEPGSYHDILQYALNSGP